MKREIIELKWRECNQCCPNHDTYPSDTYKSKLSIRARTKNKKKEHRMARHLNKRKLLKELEDALND